MSKTEQTEALETKSELSNAKGTIPASQADEAGASSDLSDVQRANVESSCELVSQTTETAKNEQVPQETSKDGAPNDSRDSKTKKQTHGNIKTLSELNAFSDGDCFVQFVACERLKTKEGKPYFKALFRDRKRTVQTLIWSESPLFNECANSWRLGAFYKIRASLRESNYGAKLEIRRIREVVPGDEDDGFDRDNCRPCSKTPPEAIASEILALAKRRLGKGALFNMIQQIFKENRLALSESFASRAHHRAYAGGLLEHTLSVLKIACFLCDHFCAETPDVPKNFSKNLVFAGAILHDVGKILDSETTATGARHTLAGDLLGHAVLGCRIARTYGEKAGVEPDVLTQLEHLILTHARFADWGAPMPPSTLEAMVLHYADYADSTFTSAVTLLESEEGVGAFTARKGPFESPILKPIGSYDSEGRDETSEKNR